MLLWGNGFDLPIFILLISFEGLPWWLSSKESTCQCRRSFDSWVGKIPWRRKWQPTLVFLLGKSYGQRSLVGYSPWSCKRVRHKLEAKEHTVSSGPNLLGPVPLAHILYMILVLQNICTGWNVTNRIPQFSKEKKAVFKIICNFFMNKRQNKFLALFMSLIFYRNI